MKKAIRNSLVKLLSLPILFYRYSISPLFPPCCRFTPTCSQYALEALKIHGPIKGTWLSIRRICRCHPWGGSGYDPVPPRGKLIDKNIRDFKDIHHHLSNFAEAPDDDRIVNLDYNEPIPEKGYYSIGVHPWSTTGMSDEDARAAIEKVKSNAIRNNIVAIGECGIDRLKGADLKLQERIFREHIEISETTRKPLIIHSVKSTEDIIRIKKEMKPQQLWIIHGFRGKKQTALQLIKQGIALSFGEHFNEEALSSIPEDMMFVESDESTLSIDLIHDKIYKVR